MLHSPFPAPSAAPPDSDHALLRNSALFDADWYCATYKDVALLGMDPIYHFLTIGAQLGRDPSARVSLQDYTERYKDVAQSGINPLVHYLRHGIHEGRTLCTQPARTDPPFSLGLAKRVERAIKTQKPEGQDAQYDVVRQSFDLGYYLTRNGDIFRAEAMDPIDHYLRSGEREGRAPSPFFSPKAYLSRYPDVKYHDGAAYHHWLTIGLAENRIAHPDPKFDAIAQLSGQDSAQIQSALMARHSSITKRLETGKLGEMVQKAAQLEPLIAHTWPQMYQPKLAPFHRPEVTESVTILHALQNDIGHEPGTVAILVNKPRWGAAKRMEGHIAACLAEVFGAHEIVIIFTDSSGTVPDGKFPENCRYVDFRARAEPLSQDRRERLLVEFLRSSGFRHTFNVNSRLLWAALKDYGKALAHSTRLYASLFCYDRTPLGFETGYPAKAFYRHFDIIDGFCLDSKFLRNQLIDRFLIPAERQSALRVLRTPVDQSILPAARPHRNLHAKPQVFWAGRFDQQKRLDIVLNIARKMPGVTFRLWGEKVLGAELPAQDLPPNLVFEGPYTNFKDVPLEDCDVWLYTSQWDGVPNVLLEVGMSGVPLVASIEGGCRELINPKFATPIPDLENIDQYRHAIRGALEDPAKARAKALQFRNHLLSERSREVFDQAVQDLVQKEPTNGAL